MIDPAYRKASEQTIEVFYNTRHFVIGAWQLATELSNNNDAHSQAMNGLLTMAESMLDGAIDSHLAEWEIISAQAKPEGRMIEFDKLCTAICVVQTHILAIDTTLGPQVVFENNRMQTDALEMAVKLMGDALEGLDYGTAA